MSWRAFYKRERNRNRKLRSRVRDQRFEIEDYKNKAETFYNNYMDALDQNAKLRTAVRTIACPQCGQKVILLAERKTVRYCAYCGESVFGFAITPEECRHI